VAEVPATPGGRSSRTGDERAVPDASEAIDAVTTVLERIDAAAAEKEQVSMGDLLDAVGQRSFAPLLLLAGLVIVAPIVGDVPGVPTAMGALVVLTTAQMLLRREHIWMPNWMEERAVEATKVRKAVEWLRPPGRFVDRWTRPRLALFVGREGSVVIAVACLLVALLTPVMEFVPFSANIAGLAISAFAVAMVARDGLIALVALAATGAAFFVVARAFW
jgi:hypothetical protein